MAFSCLLAVALDPSLSFVVPAVQNAAREYSFLPSFGADGVACTAVDAGRGAAEQSLPKYFVATQTGARQHERDDQASRTAICLGQEMEDPFKWFWHSTCLVKNRAPPHTEHRRRNDRLALERCTKTRHGNAPGWAGHRHVDKISPPTFRTA
jgi:hypothetical protein